MGSNLRTPLLSEHYERYLRDEDDRAFASRVSQRYSIGTLERLAWGGERMTRRAAESALQQSHADRFAFVFRHVSIPQPKSSSRLLPRLAAICAGERIAESAFIVARTTLIGLREP